MTDRDLAYVRDMVDYARRVVHHMDGVDRDRLEDDTLVQDAVVRALSTVGEAARGVSEEFRSAHPDIPWREIVGMRDVLVHDYTTINFDVVWSAATTDVPDLIPSLQALLGAADPRPSE